MSKALEALAGMPNAAEPLPNLLTGGQPSPAQLEAIKKAGVDVILDIRDPMELRPFDEPGLTEKLGIKYVNVPVSSGSLDDETMERVLSVVRSNADRPLLFHCASGNRVAGALIPYFILDKKMTEEAATELAMRLGLRGVDLLEWGLDYARRQK